MAVFPDRIVLKNSNFPDSTIRTAIGPGGDEAITQGELVIGLSTTTPNYVEIYTLDANGNVVTLGGSSTLRQTILSDTEPTTRDDGNPLVEGDFWYDTSLGGENSGNLSVYYSGTWVVVGGAGGGGGGNLGDLDDVSVAEPLLEAYRFDGGTRASGPNSCVEMEDALTDNFDAGVLVGPNAIELATGNTVNLQSQLGNFGDSGIIWWSNDGQTWTQWAYTVAAINRYSCTGLTELAPVPDNWVDETSGVPAYITLNDPANAPVPDGSFIKYSSADGEWQAKKLNSKAIVSVSTPTVDVNGDPLEDGSLWFQSDNSQFYVFFNGSWVLISGGGGGSSSVGRGDGGDLDTGTVDSAFVFGVYGGGDIDTTTEDTPIEFVTYDVDGGEIV